MTQITAQDVRSFQKHAQDRTDSNLHTGQRVETWRKGDKMLMRYTFYVTEENNPFSRLHAKGA